MEDKADSDSKKQRIEDIKTVEKEISDSSNLVELMAAITKLEPNFKNAKNQIVNRDTVIQNIQKIKNDDKLIKEIKANPNLAKKMCITGSYGIFDKLIALLKQDTTNKNKEIIAESQINKAIAWVKQLAEDSKRINNNVVNQSNARIDTIKSEIQAVNNFNQLTTVIQKLEPKFKVTSTEIVRDNLIKQIHKIQNDYFLTSKIVKNPNEAKKQGITSSYGIHEKFISLLQQSYAQDQKIETAIKLENNFDGVLKIIKGLAPTFHGVDRDELVECILKLKKDNEFLIDTLSDDLTKHGITNVYGIADKFKLLQKDFVQSYQNINLVLTPRTVMTQIKHGDLPISFNNEVWEQLTHEVNWANEGHTKKYVSMGQSDTRERIFIDANSEYMNKLKKDAEVCKDKSIAETLAYINTYIANLLTNNPVNNGKSISILNKDMEKRLSKYIADRKAGLLIDKNGKQLPNNTDIRIEEFIDAGLMVCRHRVLLAACIIGYLIDQKMLPGGRVYAYRSEVQFANGNNMGAHYWAIYSEQQRSSLWLCDPTWGQNKELNINNLGTSKYGEAATLDMVKRINLHEAKAYIESGKVIINPDEWVFAQGYFLRDLTKTKLDKRKHNLSHSYIKAKDTIYAIANKDEQTSQVGESSTMKVIQTVKGQNYRLKIEGRGSSNELETYVPVEKDAIAIAFRSLKNESKYKNNDKQYFDKIIEEKVYTILSNEETNSNNNQQKVTY
ncbi:MAG: hypothetical protein JSS07_06315 [Proteobacteria bacterium]|nr:hypothetical protein [Pseudomonadota bacterium]